jgi:uncharacterized membrane protein
MEPSKSYMLTTVGGYIYLIAVTSLLFWCEKIRDLSSLNILAPIGPYIFALTIPLSFFIGLVAYFIINELIIPKVRETLRMKESESTDKADDIQRENYLLQYASKPLLEKVNVTTGLFYACRSFVVAFTFLGVALYPWVLQSQNHFFVIACVSSFVLATLALFVYWRFSKNVHSVITDAFTFLTSREPK